MSGTQLLKMLVNERLAAAAEEIFVLVERTILEYQDEVDRSKREIYQLKQQITLLSDTKPRDTQLVTEELLPSQKYCDSKVEQIPVLLETEIQEHPPFKNEQGDGCNFPNIEADTSIGAEFSLPISKPTTSCEPFPFIAAATVSANESIEDRWSESDESSSPGQSYSREVCEDQEQPATEEESFNFCDSKQLSEAPSFTPQSTVNEEQIPVHVGAEMEAFPEVKEEQMDVSVSSDMKVDTPIKTEVWPHKSEPSSSAANVNVNQSIDDEQNEDDRSTLPGQTPSIEVVVNLEQPATDEKKCHWCDKHFKTDTILIKHVKKCHKGKKAFVCLQCNKEFEHRYILLQHTKVHTGEKSFKCDFCDRTFATNSSCIVHMRVHTGEKPYFCKNCGKSFSYSYHLKLCKLQSNSKKPAKKVNTEEKVSEEEKNFSCFACTKKFRYKHQLISHVRMHTGEKPYSCEVCGKTFAQTSGRNVHMKVHTGERPYFCKNCGKSFRNEGHLKFCKNIRKAFRCEKCGKTFRTSLELEVHFEVHEAWKSHMSKKLQEPENEDQNQ